MKFRIYFILSVIVALSVVPAALLVDSVWATVAVSGALMILLLLLYRSVRQPLSAVENGIYLLRSQDFSSRLRPTGQIDADLVIELFNGLMESLKRERLSLMEQNKFLAKLIERSPLGIAVCDFDENIVEMNPVYIRLRTPGLEQMLRAMQPDETRVVRLATSQIYRCSRLWFMDSGFRRMFYLVEVLTDDIIRSERNVFTTIIRTIGHEVGNTLGPIRSVLDTLAEIHADEPAVAAAINGSLTSGDNLMEFVRGYAGVVKLPEPCPEPVSLADELQRMLPSLRRLTLGDTVVELSVVGEPTILQLDMMLIERAIVNIVKNAAESIGDSPDGCIAIELNGKHLTVTDNGRGITPEAADRLFTPFFSTKRPDRGIGLMLISDILRSHRASFSLQTSPATRLTTFAITFPW